MKKVVAPLIALFMLSFTITAERLTDAEREKAVMKLTKTQEFLAKTVDGLTEAQLNFKSSPESWSVAECVEHLTISENAFSEMLKGTLGSMQDESMRANMSMTDDEIYAFISSRDKKVKTSEPFEPTGKFGTYEETLANLMTKRNEHIEFMKTSQDDFRNHFTELSFGTIDAYQIVLFMAGHTERHVKQMEEIKSDTNFPME